MTMFLLSDALAVPRQFLEMLPAALETPSSRGFLNRDECFP
jgi:hypothetical protein